MSNANTDTEDFGSMIELDGPIAPSAPSIAAPSTAAGVKFCECALVGRPAAVEVLGHPSCRRCGRRRRPVPTRETRPVDLAAEQAAAAERGANDAPAEFAAIASESSRNAASAGLVRGGVLPSDVNPVAGYRVPVVAAKGTATRYADSVVGTAVTPAIAPLSTIVETPAQTAARTPAQTRANALYLTRGDLVAGVTEGALGGLLSWSGAGRLTRGQIVAALTAAGIDPAIAPAARSAHAQLGTVLSGVNASGWIVRAVRATERTAGETWSARWTAARAAGAAQVGDSAGAVSLIATLSAEGVLTIETAPDHAEAIELGARIFAQFDARIAAEIFQSGDVTAWLSSRMRTRWHGARLGGSWFIPADSLGKAEAICTELAKAWGTDWMCPAIPVTNSAQLRTGLAASLYREAEAVLADARECADVAKLAERPITDATATRLSRELTDVRERVTGFALMLGEVAVGDLRARIGKAIADLAEFASDISQRFALIFDEIGR